MQCVFASAEPVARVNLLPSTCFGQQGKINMKYIQRCFRLAGLFGFS